LGTACGYFNVPGSGIPSATSQCYSVPRGTGSNFDPTINAGVGPTGARSASTLNWTTFSQDPNFAGPISANPSVGAERIQSLFQAWYSPFEDRNGGAITIDQRLTRDISFYSSGFYSNRRSKFLNSNSANPAANGAITQVAVPTSNPYYPAGTLVGQAVASALLPRRRRRPACHQSARQLRHLA
jgi:hypothetical protein